MGVFWLRVSHVLDCVVSGASACVDGSTCCFHELATIENEVLVGCHRSQIERTHQGNEFEAQNECPAVSLSKWRQVLRLICAMQYHEDARMLASSMTVTNMYANHSKHNKSQNSDQKTS